MVSQKQIQSRNRMVSNQTLMLGYVQVTPKFTWLVLKKSKDGSSHGSKLSWCKNLIDVKLEVHLVQKQDGKLVGQMQVTLKVMWLGPKIILKMVHHMVLNLVTEKVQLAASQKWIQFSNRIVSLQTLMLGHVQVTQKFTWLGPQNPKMVRCMVLNLVTEKFS